MHVYLLNHDYNVEHLAGMGLNISGYSMYPFIKLHLLNRGLSYSFEKYMPVELEFIPIRMLYEVQLLPTEEAKELYLRSQGDFIK